MGSRFHPAPYGVYRTADGWIAISLTTPAKLAAALDSPEMAALDQPNAGVKHRDAINRLVHQLLRTRTTAALMAAFDQHDVWYAPVNDYEQVEADAQVAHNQIVQQIEHPDAGPVRLIAHPVRYDGAPPPVRRLPPRLGEHTREVLAELGCTAQEIDSLIAEGAAIARNAHDGGAA
jgi:crotonobetainyl-CoA:carnitine CoA-transferase CaiB-like acyl-CoA transferase